MPETFRFGLVLVAKGKARLLTVEVTRSVFGPGDQVEDVHRSHWHQEFEVPPHADAETIRMRVATRTYLRADAIAVAAVEEVDRG